MKKLLLFSLLFLLCVSLVSATTSNYTIHSGDTLSLFDGVLEIFYCKNPDHRSFQINGKEHFGVYGSGNVIYENGYRIIINSPKQFIPYVECIEGLSAPDCCESQAWLNLAIEPDDSSLDRLFIVGTTPLSLEDNIDIPLDGRDYRITLFSCSSGGCTFLFKNGQIPLEISDTFDLNDNFYFKLDSVELVDNPIYPFTIGFSIWARNGFCGDEVCDTHEKCGICRKDCGECPKDDNKCPISEPNDLLEVQERLGVVREALTYFDLPKILERGAKNGAIATSFGVTKYSQNLVFETTDNKESPEYINSGAVIFGKNNEGILGDYLFFDEGDKIFNYEIAFDEPGLKSKIEDPPKDLEGAALNILEDKFDIIKAIIKDNSIEFILLQQGNVLDTIKKDGVYTISLTGGISDSLHKGERRIYIIEGKKYEVNFLSINNINNNPVFEFVVNGEKISNLSTSNTFVLRDGTEIGVSRFYSIENEEIKFFMGALGQIIHLIDDFSDNNFNDKGVIINGITIENALVRINGIKENNTLIINDIDYQLKAPQGGVYIPPGHGLREFLDVPEGMLTDNWDITYEGLMDTGVSVIRFNSNGDDSYNLQFTNREGLEYDVPFMDYSGETVNAPKYGDDDDDLVFIEGNINSEEVGITNQELFVENQEPKVAGADVCGNWFNIDDGDHFVLTNHGSGRYPAGDENSFTHILNYESIDTATKELTFQDDATGIIKVSYDGIYELANECIMGQTKIVVGDNSYDVYISTGSDGAGNESLGKYPIAIDQNGDSKVDLQIVNVVVNGGGILRLGGINSSKIYEDSDKVIGVIDLSLGEQGWFAEFLNSNVQEEEFIEMGILEEGETKSYSFDNYNKRYDITLVIVNDGDQKAKFMVNGELTNELGVNETFILQDGIEITVTNIISSQAEEETGGDKAEFFMKRKKIIPVLDINNINNFLSCVDYHTPGTSDEAESYIRAFPKGKNEGNFSAALTTLASEFDGDGVLSTGADEVLFVNFFSQAGNKVDLEVPSLQKAIDIENKTLNEEISLLKMQSLDEEDLIQGLSTYGIFFEQTDESDTQDANDLTMEYPLSQRGAEAFIVEFEKKAKPVNCILRIGENIYNSPCESLDFSEYVDETLSGFVVGVENRGQIDFGNNSFSLSDLENFSVNIESNNVTVDGIAISSPVNITLYNLSFSNPIILLNGAECPADVCRILDYTNGTLLFEVQHFSSYSAAEKPPVNGGGNQNTGGGGGGGGGHSGRRSYMPIILPVSPQPAVPAAPTTQQGAPIIQGISVEKESKELSEESTQPLAEKQEGGMDGITGSAVADTSKPITLQKGLLTFVKIVGILIAMLSITLICVLIGIRRQE